MTDKLHAAKTAMCKQQHRRASLVTLQISDFQREDQNCLKFVVPRYIGYYVNGHTFEIMHNDMIFQTGIAPSQSLLIYL